MMPLFAPTLLNGIALIYLFGRKGLVTTGFFGVLPGIDINLYGPVGIIIAETLYAFPQAVLILAIALKMTDARLYEAAQSLGATPGRIFFTVTLPGVKFGLMSACFVCFILSFTDFGAPKVVGGDYAILATDIYKQVIGQQNFSMGAVVSIVLLIPTVLAFIADRLIQRRQVASIAAKAVPLVPQPNPRRDAVFLCYCCLIALLIVIFLPDRSFCLAGQGLALSARSRLLALSLLRHRWRRLRRVLEQSADEFLFGPVGHGDYLRRRLPDRKKPDRSKAAAGRLFSLPGPPGSSGTGYRAGLYLLFQCPGWISPGYSSPIPSTGCIRHHDHPGAQQHRPFLLGQFSHGHHGPQTDGPGVRDRLRLHGRPFTKTFVRVTVPVCLPAILEIGMYYFVNSMATVSAVIFLYSADLPLASVAVANMDDAGDIAPACAMSILIVLINLCVRIGYTTLTRGIKKRSQAWALR
jgi:iron(III) transport system permease protein